MSSHTAAQSVTGLTKRLEKGERDVVDHLEIFAEYCKRESNQRRRVFIGEEILVAKKTPPKHRDGWLENLFLSGKAHKQVFEREASVEIKNSVLPDHDKLIVFI